MGESCHFWSWLYTGLARRGRRWPEGGRGWIQAARRTPRTAQPGPIGSPVGLKSELFQLLDSIIRFEKENSAHLFRKTSCGNVTAEGDLVLGFHERHIVLFGLVIVVVVDVDLGEVRLKSSSTLFSLFKLTCQSTAACKAMD